MSTPELHWFKSSHSSSAGDDRVGTAAALATRRRFVALVSVG
ncbi:hypothetical protein ACFXI6_10005 [Streptomyces mirabilis]